MRYILQIEVEAAFALHDLSWIAVFVDIASCFAHVIVMRESFIHDVYLKIQDSKIFRLPKNSNSQQTNHYTSTTGSNNRYMFKHLLYFPFVLERDNCIVHRLWWLFTESLVDDADDVVRQLLSESTVRECRTWKPAKFRW
jgi:hypothetical protein